MDSQKIHLYSVALNYRKRRQYKGQRWHDKYKWRSKSYIVRCYSQVEAVLLTEQHFTDTHTAKYDLKVNYILELE